MPTNKLSRKALTPALIFSSLVFFVSIILYRMIVANYRLSFPDFLLIVFLSLLSSGILHRLIEFSFTEKGVIARFREVKENVKIINEIAKHVLTEGELLQLKHLNRKENYIEVKYCDFLFREMIRLCQHKFVAETYTGAVWDMQNKHHNDSGNYNLKDYFQITEDGISYLKLLEDLEKIPEEINNNVF